MTKYVINTDEKRIDIFNQRWYPYGSDFYLNVTAILEEWAKGYGFEDWLKDNDRETTQRIAKRAMERGSIVHNFIDSFFKDLNLQFVDGASDLEAWEIFNGLSDKDGWIHGWYLPNKDKYYFIESERILYDNDIFVAGTCDLIVKNKETNLFEIFDWKTGKNNYDINFMQLSAYSVMLKKELGLDYIPAIHIVLINKEVNQKWIRQYDLKEQNELQKYYDLFLAANTRHKREQPKFFSLPLEISKKDFEISN